MTLPQEAVQHFDLAVWHINNRLHPLHKLIVALKICDFLGKIVLDCLLNTAIEEFSMGCSVEITIIIGRLIPHIYVPVRCGLPIDELKQWL